MLNLKYKIIDNTKAILGESPVYDQATSSFYWIDILGKKIFNYSIKTNKFYEIKTKGLVGLITNYDQQYMLVGISNSLFKLNKFTNKFKLLTHLPNIYKSYRFNDGEIDMNKNLWFGLVKKNKNIKKGILMKLSPDLKPFVINDKYKTPNGPVFNNKRKIFYSVDSSKKIIYCYSNLNHTTMKRKIFKKFNFKIPSPDGVTLDRKGNLWVAIYRKGYVYKINQKSKVTKKIKLPTKLVTSCAFGGKNNDLLFVTSARKDSKIPQYKNENSGYCFLINSLRAVG